APGALARDAPVRTALDHAADAPLAPGREPAAGVADARDLVHGVAAQAGLVHGDEPLRRGAEGHRRLVPPAVRITVRDGGVREQHSTLTQQVDDEIVGLPDVLAG